MFSINARICTLKRNSSDQKNVILSENVKYIVPIYQRSYEWAEEELQKFISNLFVSFWGNEGLSPSEPMFYGTMQLSHRNEKNEHEIIDGQQRLSTILVLLLVLQKLFPENKELQSLNFSWLNTRVQSGKQQENLEKILSPDFKFSKKGSNPYQKNAAIIKALIAEQICDKEFDDTRFIEHLLGGIYFAVIETEAGLSKTLQIFNAINTTGLDLNGADVFKIRMYEYLHDKKGQDETAFIKIDQLYRSIDDNNTALEWEASSMDDILKIYQYVLIARYQLPRVLYTYGSDTFFEQLFDTILKNNLWDHFKNNVDKVELSLQDLDRIIEIRYEWENSSYETVEDACSMNFIDWSRYSRYSILVFLFLYKFKGEKDYFHNMLQFIHQISKVYVIYSIRFQKVIYDIHTFTYDLIEKILEGDYEKIMSFVNEKIGTLDDHHQGWYDIVDILNGDITFNRKLKDMVCRLSAMLHENYKTASSKTIEKIQGNLFWGNVPIDIEHIQPSLDEDGNKREAIWEEWGDDLNSIGNLMVLESDINRSIGNKTYPEKIKRYSESVFKVVKEQPKKYPEWNVQICRKRKEYEVTAILEYLFTK
jgi:uncharacterized protein with ParB-like and HNH nuclease domain